MNSSVDFAYAAGYIDGDGCFFIGKIKTSPFYQDTFSIISTDFENIKWFKAHFDGNIHCKSSKQKNRLPSYHFVFSKKGYKDLSPIYIYLVEKKRQCDVFLNFRNPLFKSERDSLIESMNHLKNHSDNIRESIKENIEIVKNSTKPSISDYAYLAGFIDAECSFGVIKRKMPGTRNPLYRAQLQMSNTKSPIFYWISQRFGGQFHFDERSKRNPKWRNQMIWRISNAQLLPILENVHPFLKHKKPACEMLIDFQKTVLPRKGNPSPSDPKYQDFYQSLLEIKESIYQQIRHFNKTV